MKFRGLVEILVCATAFTACASSQKAETVSAVPDSATNDSEYAGTLQKWQRSENVFHLFQNQLSINAVMLSSEFRKSYSSRMTRLRGDSRNSLEESVNQRVGFLVSITSPFHAYETLDDKRIWGISLKYGNSKIQNNETKLLADKVILEPFFPFITQWSREFLVTFEPAELGEQSQSVTLLLKSALASVEMEWHQ